MKMKDVFELPLSYDKEQDTIRSGKSYHDRDNCFYYKTEDGHYEQVCIEPDEAEYIVHAVNSHDSLTSQLEVAELLLVEKSKK